MNPIEHIRRIAAVLAGLAAALMAVGVTPAFAKVQPEPGGAGAAPIGSAPPSVQVHTVSGGMPAWQVALIAIAAALLSAAVAVLAERARASRRRATTAVA